jgi:hypothetical protein
MTKLGQQIAMGYSRTKIKVLSAVSKKKASELAIELFSTPQFHYKKSMLKIFAEAEKLEFSHYGETVTGYRWNRGGHRSILIVHGFNSSVTKFDCYLKPLINKGYIALVFDIPAHGFSTCKPLNAVVFKDRIITINKIYRPVKSFMDHSFGSLDISLALEEIPHDEDYLVVLIAPATESNTAIDFFLSCN